VDWLSTFPSESKWGADASHFDSEVIVLTVRQIEHPREGELFGFSRARCAQPVLE